MPDYKVTHTFVVKGVSLEKLEYYLDCCSVLDISNAKMITQVVDGHVFNWEEIKPKRFTPEDIVRLSRTRIYLRHDSYTNNYWIQRVATEIGHLYTLARGPLFSDVVIAYYPYAYMIAETMAKYLNDNGWKEVV